MRARIKLLAFVFGLAFFTGLAVAQDAARFGTIEVRPIEDGLSMERRY